ncbi:MAG: hypothetical protein VX516_04130, partial [Actinomycetota bacterium]|nr:hypothetical protein [Actinomycetota bacterium]
MTRDSISVWALRGAWLVQPVTLGPALDDGLEGLDGRTFLSVAVWVLWALGLLATLAPRPVTLTAIRIGGPATAALSVWTATAVDDTTAVVAALVGAFALGVLSHWPGVADACVDGASYGDEKRFLLRAPGPVVLALGPFAWVLTVAGTVAGPLLLAAGNVAIGSTACVAGLPVAAATIRAIHHLHRRWIVLVPAGFVLHDHLALADGFHDLDGHTFLSASAWVLWGLGLLATLVPRPVTLTAIRIGGPAAAALSVWTATTVDDAALVAVALGGAFVLGVLSHWPAVADTYVDGASYGDEKRFLLRAPGPVVLALGPLAWALTVAGVVVGPLLLASG